MTDITLDNILAVLNEFRNRYPNSAYQTNVIEVPTDLSVAISADVRVNSTLVIHARHPS